METATAVRIGRKAPDFQLACIDHEDLTNTFSATLSRFRGRWLILVFYPRDFSFVCPTELISFSARMDEFALRNCDLLGISVDQVESHREWLMTPEAEGGIGSLRFSLASDPTGDAARVYGVWDDEQKVACRGLYIINPEGILEYAVVHNLNVGRNVDEVMRILDALQTGGLCPASWTQADGTIDVEAALRPGSVLGHYRIQRELGSGAFGSVFAAEDLNLQRHVALKVMRDVHHESRESLLSEARMAASLNHPNVCTVYSVEEIDGVPAIAMEYITGPSLAKLIAVGLEPGRIRDLALGIAQGLAAAHSLQIVHSDLKPLNILIAEDGTPKILDFGLARMRTIRPSSPKPSEIADGVPNDADLEETVDFSTSPARQEPDPAKHSGSTGDSVRVETSKSSFTLRGTPAYMTPEHSTGRTIGQASDVFALGLIMFEMVTGKKALADSSVVSVLTTLQDDDLSGRLSRGLDEPYQSLVRKMLDKSPEHRPSAAQVAERLGE